VHGANHNFVNTLWSPGSGQPDAGDDADTGGHPQPGTCVHYRSGQTEKQLTEDRERTVVAGYAAAFFTRYLDGDSGQDAILNGRRKPFEHLTPVDIDVTH
jgi:hypothetical protein